MKMLIRSNGELRSYRPTSDLTIMRSDGLPRLIIKVNSEAPADRLARDYIEIEVKYAVPKLRLCMVHWKIDEIMKSCYFV